jgi:hypothetical protein
MCPNASNHEDICGVKELLHIILTSKRDWVSNIGGFTTGKKPPVLINKRKSGYYSRSGSFGGWVGTTVCLRALEDGWVLQSVWELWRMGGYYSRSESFGGWVVLQSVWMLWRINEFLPTAGNRIRRSSSLVQVHSRRHLPYKFRSRSQTRPCGRSSMESVIVMGFAQSDSVFLLSRSFHHCSTLIHSPTNDVFQSHWERHFKTLLCLCLSCPSSHSAQLNPTLAVKCLSNFLIVISLGMLPRLFYLRL